MKWTRSQYNAITMKTKDALIAAAAGSGKTATLTERVIRMLTDPVSPADISRMLIVTFTKKAAEELKLRVRSKLTDALVKDPDNAHLKRQLSLLPSASVCTIHSFYLKVIKEGFSKLGIPPAVKTADEADTTALRQQIMNEVIDSYYNGELDGTTDIEDTDGFFDTFEKIKPSGQELANTFLSLFEQTSSYPEYLEFYRGCAKDATGAAACFDGSKYDLIIKAHVKRSLLSLISAFERIDLKYSGDGDYMTKLYPASLSCSDYAAYLIKQLDTKDREAFRSVITQKPALTHAGVIKGDSECKAEYNACRKKFTEELNGIKKLYSFNADDTRIICSDTAALTEGIYKLLCRFDARYTAAKLQRHVLDFSDMERYTYTLLCGDDGEYRERFKNRYDCIFIDEYQDVNRIQDRIFASISKNNRFMVGDVKQSIYSFRGSDPGIFTSYRDSFSAFSGDGPDPSVIFLSDNFRCGKPVVDFTNELFGALFGADPAMPYTNDDALVFSKQAELREDVPVTLAFLNGGTPEDEAVYIAEKIKYLLKYGKNDDGSPIKLSDITVLCRTADLCSTASDVLERQGVSCANTSNSSFFDSAEVLLVLSVLSAVDNPSKDVPLSAVMRSPLFGFTLDELAEIRLHQKDVPFYVALLSYTEQTGSEKCRAFLDKLDALREKSRSMRTDKFIRYIYRELSVTSVIFNPEDQGDPGNRKNNLRLLYETARTYESDSFKGLCGFINYCTGMIEKNSKFKTGADTAGKLCIQTLHASKGLEYPVCFIMGASKQFNTDYNKRSIITSPDAGIGIRTKNSSDMVKKGPIYDAVLLDKYDTTVKDEACLFYVGVTRAKKYLYITSSSKNAQRLSGNISPDAYFSCRSFTDMMICALDGNGKSYVCEYIDKGEAEEAYQEKADKEPRAHFDEEIYQRLKQIKSYVYPYKDASQLPRKAAVSALFPSYLDEFDDVAVVEQNEEAEEIQLAMPDYYGETEEKDAASAGVATHLFMQFCDFDNAEADVEKEALRLVSLGFMRQKAAELISFDEVKSFFASPLYKRMAKAKADGRYFYREYRFNIELDAADFTQDEQRKKALCNEKLLVQGVIDCFFEEEDGSITAVDYKTDRIGRSENAVAAFAERHRKQLGYYKEAIQRITLKPVDRCELFSFCLGRSVIL